MGKDESQRHIPALPDRNSGHQSSRAPLVGINQRTGACRSSRSTLCGTDLRGPPGNEVSGTQSRATVLGPLRQTIGHSPDVLGAGPCHRTTWPFADAENPTPSSPPADALPACAESPPPADALPACAESPPPSSPNRPCRSTERSETPSTSASITSEPSRVESAVKTRARIPASSAGRCDGTRPQPRRSDARFRRSRWRHCR